jgi:hypothetical protein
MMSAIPKKSKNGMMTYDDIWWSQMWRMFPVESAEAGDL